jgi:hypothetical protein
MVPAEPRPRRRDGLPVGSGVTLLRVAAGAVPFSADDGGVVAEPAAVVLRDGAHRTAQGFGNRQAVAVMADDAVGEPIRAGPHCRRNRGLRRRRRCTAGRGRRVPVARGTGGGDIAAGARADHRQSDE